MNPLINQLLDAVAVPAWLHQAGQPLRGNPALARLCGMDATALRQTPHLAMVATADRAALAAATQACLEGGDEPPAQAAGLLAANGAERRVELTLRRVAWDGQTMALVTCVDHSDFHHVQDSLQAMSGLLRQIVDGAPVASFVIDSQHRVTHWNSACERLTGCSAQTMVGTTEAWRAFYPERRPLLADMIVSGVDTSTLMSLYQQSARANTLNSAVYEAEAFFPNLGPSGRWLFFTAAPLSDGHGQVIGAIETLQDITSRRLAENELAGHRQALEDLVAQRSAALAASTLELEAFIDNAPFGVLYAAQGQILRSNRKSAELFGLSEGSLAGQAASNFYLSADDYAELGQMARPLLSAGQPLHHEMWMRHSSGKPLWMQISAYVSDYNNAAAGAWWMLQDRSEVRNAQEALRERFAELQETNRRLEAAQNQLLQSEKMASIGQLAAGVAHEINNPVGFVSSNLNTLRQYVEALMALVDAHQAAAGTAANSPAAQHLATLLADVELDYLRDDLPQLLDESADGLARVKKIVQDLKDFSRVDQADWQAADLNAGLQSTLNVVRHEIKYKAEVVLALGPMPLVTCLAGQLNQVFLNLIVNASQAIAEHGVITLASGTDGGWAWVQVSDTGCGMSEEVRRRIFEPFYTTKEVGKGTGLGLSLSFSIVQRHGGVIQVHSVPGAGSQFRVWVPLDGPAGAGQALAPSVPDWHGVG